MQNKNKKLEKFFNPSSIAIVGATDGVGKTGTVITRNILNLGYRGRIFLVNPKRKTLHGRTCYASLAEIKEEIDLAVVVVPSDLVCGIVGAAAEKVRNFIVISAGFSEAGGEGKSRENRLKRIAREKNISILGPNCLGVIFPGLKLNASFSGGLPLKGNVAFISQSGALAVALMDIFRGQQVGFSGIVSIGNKMDIDEADIMEHFGSDRETKVLGLYLEGIKYGRKFMETCAKIAAQKPVIILKAGKSQRARQAIASHTGALAGEKESTGAVFEKCNVIEAENFEQFVDLVKLASFSSAPEKSSSAIITNAGGAGVIAADAFEGKFLALQKFTDKLKEEIKSYLPRAASAENPIDVLGDAHEDRYRHVFGAIGKENLGFIGIILTPQDQTPVEKVARAAGEFAKKSHATLACSFIGKERVGKGLEVLAEEKIPNFETPERMVAAVDKYYRWNAGRKKNPAVAENVNYRRQKEAAEIIRKAQAEGRKLLFYREAQKIFALYDIPVMESWSSVHSSSIKFPAVIKLDDGKLAHKTGKNAIFAGIKDHRDLARAAQKIQSYFPGSGIVVQPQSENHLEIIIGVKKDEVFGPILTFGLGGIYAENFQLVDFLVPPNEISRIRDKIKDGCLGSIFAGARGLKYNPEELAKIIKAVGRFSLECPQIRGLDVNPLFVYNNGRKAVCADIKIFI